MRAGNGSSILAVEKKSVEICSVLANEQYDEKKYDFPHNQNTLQAFYWYFVSNASFEWCSENYREHLIVFYENGQLFCRHDVLCRGRITKSS